MDLRDWGRLQKNKIREGYILDHGRKEKLNAQGSAQIGILKIK